MSLILPPRFWQERKQQVEALISDLQNASSLISDLAEAGGESGEDVRFLLERLKAENGFEAYTKIKADKVALFPEDYTPLPLLICASLWALSHGVRLLVDQPSDRYLSGICEILEKMTYPGFILPGKDCSVPRLQVIPHTDTFSLPGCIGRDIADLITRFNGRVGNSLKLLAVPCGKTDEVIFRLVTLGGRFTTPHEEEILLSRMKAGSSFREALRDISSLEKDRFIVTLHSPALSVLPVVRVIESDRVPDHIPMQSEFFSLNLS